MKLPFPPSRSSDGSGVLGTGQPALMGLGASQTHGAATAVVKAIHLMTPRVAIENSDWKSGLGWPTLVEPESSGKAGRATSVVAPAPMGGNRCLRPRRGLRSSCGPPTAGHGAHRPARPGGFQPLGRAFSFLVLLCQWARPVSDCKPPPRGHRVTGENSGWPPDGGLSLTSPRTLQ